MKDIGIDVSSYEPTLKAAELKGNVAWIAAKACEVDDQYRNGWNANQSVDLWVDESFAGHCQTAYDLGVPFCAYIFDNPAYKMDWYASAYGDHTRNPNDRDPQILALRQALKNKLYHAICIDVERWWKFYNQYYASLNGGAPAEKIPSTWIRDSAADLYKRIQEEQAAGRLRQVPIWIYTGKWFVDSYAPELDTFMADKIQWITYYQGGVYTGTKGTTTWAKVKELIAAETFKPAWIGNKKPEVLQLTDKAVLPGIYGANGALHPVDLDVTQCEIKSIFAAGTWPDITPLPDPTPDPVPADILAALKQIDVRLSALQAQVNDIDADVMAIRSHFKP